MTKASTEDAEVRSEVNPSVSNEPTDNTDTTCTLRGRTDVMTESDSSEDLQTEPIDGGNAA